MASPRELAEKAFALLQNALSESEARATEVDEQLKRKRAPKTRVEEQADVLAHRLESVEAERLRWEQQAGHLEEIAEAERIKVAQLKKKLEIAESGPDKLTKKEVNFWRAKSETIDAQIKEYQERLNALRRELNERDALIETLKSSGAPNDHAREAEAPDSEPEAEQADTSELRRQLDQRDAWLAELRLELHELRAEPAPPLETQAEVETLRSQITRLERSLAESHNLRAAAQGDLMRAEHEIAARERAVREGNAASERVKTTLAEREHRIVELTAEIENLRNDLRQRHELDREDVTGYEEQIAALTRDADALRTRIEQDRHDNGSARAALEIALHEREQELEKQRQLVDANERDFAELRRQLEEREQAAHDLRHRIEEQRDEKAARDREIEVCQLQLRELTQTLAEREEQSSVATADVEQIRATLTAQGEEIASLREAAAASERELENVRETAAASARELESAQESSATSERELDELRSALADAQARLTDTETRLADAQAQAEAVARDMESAREQLAGIEAELKEERENAESLGEIANERREHMTKLQEQVEEAEERYADANWRLGKSLYFERIVKRRKGLIKKLLEALRAKMKANQALKAGVDGLRTYKQTADMNQHKLLQRIDGLKAELQEAQEAVKRHEGGTAAKEEVTNAVSRATELEARLNTQAELIQSLESDLKAARLAQKASDAKNVEAKTGKTQEVERLAKELDAKNQTIAELQVYADEQQKKLARLRTSESETMRLKAINEKERSEIDALQTEVTQLREALEGAGEKAKAEFGAKVSGLEGKLKERDGSIARLMATIKEHETAIKKLTESGESWKRKYQFLASDQPDAYKSAAEK